MENRKAVVTGTSSGLGADIADWLLAEQVQVHGVSRTRGNVESEAYLHHNVDITNLSELRDMFNRIGNFDILINNAGVFHTEKFEDMDEYKIEHMIDVNVKGTIMTTQYALPFMNEGGHIVFINSVAGLEEIENQAVYCASKYALTAFAGVLGKELRARKIRVSSIHPGGIDTPLWNRSNPYNGDRLKLLQPSDIQWVLKTILYSHSGVDIKTIKMFPTNEWH